MLFAAGPGKGHIAVTCRITLNRLSTAAMCLMSNYFEHCYLWTPIQTVAQRAKHFEPSTVLWAFHTIQPSSFGFVIYKLLLLLFMYILLQCCNCMLSLRGLVTPTLLIDVRLQLGNRYRCNYDAQ